MAHTVQCLARFSLIPPSLAPEGTKRAYLDVILALFTSVYPTIAIATYNQEQTLALVETIYLLLLA